MLHTKGVKGSPLSNAPMAWRISHAVYYAQVR
jgi:hypothetical protein